MIRVLKERECIYLIANNYIGYLSYIYNDKPFIAPITYFFNEEKNIVIGYSDRGHKINAMRVNSSVSMVVTDIDAVDDWESAQIHGTFEQVYGSEAKSYLHEFSLGVKDLVIRKEKRDLDFIREFSSNIKDGEEPIVFIIKVNDITGRMRRQ